MGVFNVATPVPRCFISFWKHLFTLFYVRYEVGVSHEFDRCRYVSIIETMGDLGGGEAMVSLPPFQFYNVQSTEAVEKYILFL